MDGDSWIEQVLRRDIDDSDFVKPREELVGGVRSLFECGVLTPEQATRAMQLINDGRRPEVVRAPGSYAPAARGVPIAVAAPVAPLADVDDLTLYLVTIEFWTSHVSVRLAAGESETLDRMHKAHEAEISVWERARQEEGYGRKGRPPRSAVLKIGRIALELSDDLGTAYHAGPRSAGGSGRGWRGEWEFHPAPPEAATRLRLTAGDADDRQSLDVPIPLRS